MKAYIFISIFICLLLLCPLHPCWGQPSHSIPHSVAGCGGGRSNAGGIYIHDTIGQPVIGTSSIAVQGDKIGYWYVVDGLNIGPTSEVTFVAFTATLFEEGIELTWEIGSALELEGFNVYRSIKEELDYELLNKSLLLPEDEYNYFDRNIHSGTTYWYKVGAVDRDGEFISPVVKVDVPARETTLYQNFPNPFNPMTTIAFYLPEVEHVTLAIYDVRGQHVRTLLNEKCNYGKHNIKWNGKNDQGESVGSGVYFYHLRAGKKKSTKKLTLLR
jgi:hypothetical protein